MRRQFILKYENEECELDSEKDFFIGRLSGNDLCLKARFVSRRHARIFFSKSVFSWEDLNSTFGTTLVKKNGKQYHFKNESVTLDAPCWIRPGDGDLTILFTFRKAPMNRTIADGKDLMDGGRYRQARDLFRDIILKNPQDPDGYYYAGLSAYKLGDLQDAIDGFSTYLFIRKDDLAVRLDLGKVYEKIGRMDLAERCYKFILEKKPEHPRALKRVRNLDRHQPGTGRKGVSKKTGEIFESQDTTVRDVQMGRYRVTYEFIAHNDTIKEVLKALEIARGDLGKILAFLPADPIRVNLEIPIGSVAGQTDREGITLSLDKAHLDERPFLDVLVTHEYAHYALGSYTDFSPHLPWWLHEGFAQHASQKLTLSRLMGMRQVLDAGELKPLSELTDEPSEEYEDEVLDVEYLHAHAAVEFFMEFYGHKGLRVFAKALEIRKDIDKAFKKIGTTLSRFEKEWVDWIKANALEDGNKLTQKIHARKF